MEPSPTPFVNFDFRTIDWRVIFAFLAIIVAVVLAFYFQWWRNRKRLSYEILSDVELVSSERIRDKIEIRYEGKPVESVHLVVVKLINDGYQPIKKDEFEKPIKFIFRGGKILSAEKETFQPENIATAVFYQDRYVEITPTLFNRKDYVQFKVLLDGFTEMEIDARIVGVSKIGRVRNLGGIEASFVSAAMIVALLVNISGYFIESRWAYLSLWVSGGIIILIAGFKIAKQVESS